MAIQSYVRAVGNTSQIEIVRGHGGESYVLLNNVGSNEVYLDGANDEIQNVALTGGPAGGTFTLTYSGQTTAGIAYDASETDVQAALIALSNIGPTDVVVSEGNDGLPTGFVAVRFTGTKAGANQPSMTGSGAGLTGGSAPGVSITVAQAGGVDSADSWSLAASGTLSFYLKGDDVLYAICASGETTNVQVLRIG